DSREVFMDPRIKKVPPKIGWYLAGFADGEGSFNVVLRKREDYRLKWKVSLCFNVSQKERVILALFKRHLGCGTLRQREDGIYYYEVNNFNAIVNNVIPFFERFGFLSATKKKVFSKFKKIAELMQEGKHLTVDGLIEILKIRQKMNDGGKRDHTYEEVVSDLLGKSSEAIRQVPRRT
ncbi:hypothetical protein DRQ23_03020, partial [bacterium]